MRPVDEVWNRACAEAGRPKALTASGDRALADMLLAHGLVMNGGVLHAVECLDEHERLAAVNGYRYFGLERAAAVIEDAAVRWRNGELALDEAEQLEMEADERYGQVVGDDDVLVQAFEATYRREPSRFAPLH
jgi:hypothetical protein